MAEPRCASYYTASINNESAYPTLDSERRVDVAIVGGGFTGIATAVELAQRGYKVALVEGNKVGWGASGRNGGQVTGSLSGQDAMLKKMCAPRGGDIADFVWKLRWRGHGIIEDRVRKYDIACDLKHGHLQAAYKPSHINALRADFDELVERGMQADVHWLTRDETRSLVGTDLYHAALRNDRDMHVHPLNLCLGEARVATGLGVEIYEDSQALRIEHGSTPAVVTTRGRIVANSVVLAGNAYHRLEQPKLGGKLFPAVLNIITTAPLTDAQVAVINPQDLAVYDTRFVLDYYRLTADKRLLFGGGTNYSGRNSRDIVGELRPRLEHTFPQLRSIAVDFQWQCTAGIVINRIPMLGRIADNVYYAQGYSGHGIATTHVVAEIMANALSGTLEDFDAFAHAPHLRIPLGERFGNTLVALGMWYYQLLERLR